MNLYSVFRSWRGFEGIDFEMKVMLFGLMYADWIYEKKLLKFFSNMMVLKKKINFFLKCKFITSLLYL